MLCIGIIWNSANEFKDYILSDITEYGEILNSFDLRLGEQYESFVRDIYSGDDIDDWKIDKKIETMNKSSYYQGVAVIVLDVDTTEQYYHEYKKRIVYANLERMKTNIRKKYSQLVSNYFFDNVFHLTDDEKEYERCVEVLSKYSDEELMPKEENKVKRIMLKKINKLNY